MTVKIEKIDPADEEKIELLNSIAVYSFHSSPNKTDFKDRLKNAKYRSDSDQFLLFEGDEAVATSTIHPLTQHLREKIVNVGGIATIGTLPHARRKGYVRNLMDKSFETMKSNKQLFSLLHPFRESFYYQFGYITLPDRILVKINTESLRSIRKFCLTSKVELIDLKEDLVKVREFKKRIQLKTPGMIMFSENKFQQNSHSNLWLAKIFDEEKELKAIITYQMEGYMKPLIVHDLHYDDSFGKYACLSFFSNHLDHANSINLYLKRSDHFENWLTDLEYEVIHRAGAMARIVNIELLNSLTLKVGNGKVLLRVQDQNIEQNNGTFIISGENNELKFERSNSKSVSFLDIRVLTSLIYGTYDLDDFQIKGLCKINLEEKIELKKIFPNQLHEVLTYF